MNGLKPTARCKVKKEDLEDAQPQRGRPRQFDRHKALCDALRLFWIQGYQQTTTAQLCEAMGINSPSLYCAFGSKGELFLEALAYYRSTYWNQIFNDFKAEKDIYTATRNLLLETARVLLQPSAPCGCMTVLAAATLPACESEILKTITILREQTRTIFRDRLMQAIHDGQIPVDSDIPAIVGSLINFFEGLTLQAKDNICLAELQAIAVRGVRLLPTRQVKSEQD